MNDFPSFIQMYYLNFVMGSNFINVDDHFVLVFTFEK